MHRPLVRLPLLACCAVGAGSHADAEVLWDNGDPSLVSPFSHLSGEGQRRSVLDDFGIAAHGWRITRFAVRGAAGDNTWGAVSDVELTIHRDRDGAPDFDDLVAAFVTTGLIEALDPNAPPVFGMRPVIVQVDLEPLALGPGAYWLDMHVVNPVNWAQWTAEGITGRPAWVDYEDFGGRQPARNVYGGDYDVNFILEGEVIPAPPVTVLLALAVPFVNPGRRRRSSRP